MFDRVGDIGLVAVDAGFVQGTVEDFAGRADERPPGEIFLVAGLLADQHDRRVRRTFAEHGLGGVAPQRAGPAVHRFLAQVGKAEPGKV